MAKGRVTEQELNRIMATDPTDGLLPDTAAASGLVKLLATLDRALLKEIMVEQRAKGGDVLFWEGDAGDALYLIWSGHTAVVKGQLTEPTEVLFRGPGDVVGEMALLEDKPRWGSLVALDEVRLLRIERAGFHKLLQAQPAISINLLSLLSSRLRATHEMSQANIRGDQQVLRQISSLMDENEQLMELQQIRQETNDLIVHDLRSPLNNMISVLNMLELVLPEEILAANQELLNIARLANTRMQDLVDSLLDVSKLEAGEMVLDLGPACMKMLVDEVVAMASLSLEQRGIHFRLSIAPDLPFVMADEDRIRRVLTNLLDNAMKFTPRDGRVAIEVTAVGREMQVAVSDSGSGIPAADRQRIFERFAQIQRTGMRRVRGFGLGLAFCRLVVTAHGGHIWVEPGEGGVGSRFVFTLPLSQNND